MIIATCGHEIFDVFAHQKWKDFTREWEPCEVFGTLCPKCEAQYYRMKILIEGYYQYKIKRKKNEEKNNRQRKTRT